MTGTSVEDYKIFKKNSPIESGTYRFAFVILEKAASEEIPNL
jgi:hypothetical protein